MLTGSARGTRDPFAAGFGPIRGSLGSFHRRGQSWTTQRGAQQAERRLSQLERNERDLNDRIEALERARREAEARGAPAGPASITTADLGRLAWPVEGRLLYQFGIEQGPNNTRIPRHGIGIAAAVGAPVKVVAAGRDRKSVV